MVPTLSAILLDEMSISDPAQGQKMSTDTRPRLKPLVLRYWLSDCLTTVITC